MISYMTLRKSLRFSRVCLSISQIHNLTIGSSLATKILMRFIGESMHVYIGGQEGLPKLVVTFEIEKVHLIVCLVIPLNCPMNL